MSPPGSPSHWLRVLTLSRTRLLLLGMRYRLLVGGIGMGYVLGTMLFSGMLYIPTHPLRLAPFLFIDPSGYGPSWTYPAIFAGDSYFQLDLPILSTILMTLSAAGVGLGMALGLRLGSQLIRQRRAGLVRPTALGTTAGLAPALIALVTLGACCSTAAATTAGFSLAHSSLLSAAGTWASGEVLGIVQVGVVYLALVAQESLVSLYPLLPNRTAAPV